MNNISKRYLLRVAINLYSVVFDKLYEFGGEIDEIDKNGNCNNKELNEFCTSFLNMFYDKNKLRFFEIVNELSMIDNKRSVFFKMCCDKEVELIFNNEPPLVFYWCDYFKYEESGFDCVLELSKLLTSNYLSQKKQLPIEIIKYHINDIIISFKHTFEGLKKVILFGSVAKHTNTETSDIDLLLIFDINNPLSNRMSFILKEEFYKNTGRILDVSFVFKGQSNRFIEWILSYGIEVYNDEK